MSSTNQNIWYTFQEQTGSTSKNIATSDVSSYDLKNIQGKIEWSSNSPIGSLVNKPMGSILFNGDNELWETDATRISPLSLQNKGFIDTGYNLNPARSFSVSFWFSTLGETLSYYPSSIDKPHNGSQTLLEIFDTDKGSNNQGGILFQISIIQESATLLKIKVRHFDSNRNSQILETSLVDTTNNKRDVTIKNNQWYFLSYRYDSSTGIGQLTTTEWGQIFNYISSTAVLTSNGEEYIPNDIISLPISESETFISATLKL